MAITTAGTLGTGASGVSGTTLITTTTATLNVGQVGILVIGSDNTATTDADHSEITGVVDSVGNVWTKCAEYTNGNGAAATGVTSSVWQTYATVQIPIGGTITATLGTARVDKCASAWKFNAGGPLTQAAAAVGNATDGAGGFGSVNFTGLASAARLYFRGLVKEVNTTTQITPSGSFTAITVIRSRNNTNAVSVRGEFRINTSTGETSNPTLATVGDTAGVFLALTDADTTAPTLTSAVGTSTGSTTATVGATTNEGNGTLYAVVTTSSTGPSAAQVKAGQNHLGAAATWSGNQAVATTGAKTLNATGLTGGVTYWGHLMHEDAATNQSSVVSSSSFASSTTFDVSVTFGIGAGCTANLSARSSEAIAGQRPSAYTKAFLAWRDTVVASREAFSPKARAVTYYVSSSTGSDSNDGLSEGAALATLSAAQAKLDARDRDTAILLKRGDTWRVGQTGSQGSVIRLDLAETIADYGDLATAKPVIVYDTDGTHAYSSGWSLAAGNRYTRTGTGDVAWVIRAADRLTLPLVRLASSAAVEAQGPDASKSIGGSFFYDPAGTPTLHVNVGAAGPNSMTLEVIVSNAVNGIHMAVDNMRAENIELYGFGCHRTTTATQCEGIHHEATGEGVAKGTVSLYGGSHAHVMVGAGSGGVLTSINCIAGYSKYNGASGENAFNAFKTLGDHECWWINCTAYGTLPSSDWTWATESRGVGFYGHTNGSTLGRLFVRSGCTLAGTAGTFPSYEIGAIGNVTTGEATDGTTFVDILIGCIVSPLADTGRSRIGIGWLTPVYLDCEIHWKQTAAYNITAAFTGALIATRFYIDATPYSAGPTGIFNVTPDSANVGIIDGCWFEIKTSSQSYILNWNYGGVTAAKLRNSVMAKAAGSGAGLVYGIRSTAGYITDNAWWGADTPEIYGGSDSDANAVLLGSLPDEGNVGPTSPLYRQGTTDTIMEYGAGESYMNLSAPTIGPWQESAGNTRRRLMLLGVGS
jgi:hypothetical protein